MKHLRIAGALALVLILSACGQTPFGDMARGQIATRGATAYDTGLENAEWFLCQAASVGSVKRRYGVSDQTATAYNKLCRQEGEVAVITVPGAVE
ncbi:MAG: hypothetical protein O2985_16515 [Proteobacteria bacterium]|nr:hypothetical protein [Pseudomonadota bacterium]